MKEASHKSPRTVRVHSCDVAITDKSVETGSGSMVGGAGRGAGRGPCPQRPRCLCEDGDGLELDGGDGRLAL